MSESDLNTVLDRMNTDSKFVGQLLRNFDQAVTQNGYVLDDAETARVKGALNGTGLPSDSQISNPNIFSAPAPQTPIDPDVRARQQTMANFSLGLLKSTLTNAKLTYQLITLMNAIMFCMGVGLFLFAAIYGARSQNLTFTAAFAGLGAASFVALFMLGPIDKTQDALSNLIQAEVAFMNFYDQMCMLEAAAALPLPGTNVPCVPNIERASALLQKRTEETLDLFQVYLEDRPASRDSKARSNGTRKLRRGATSVETAGSNGKDAAGASVNRG